MTQDRHQYGNDAYASMPNSEDGSHVMSCRVGLVCATLWRSHAGRGEMSKTGGGNDLRSMVGRRADRQVTRVLHSGRAVAQQSPQLPVEIASDEQQSDRRDEDDDPLNDYERDHV